MIQIVEVEQQGLSDDVRDAFCLAAAERFLEGSVRDSFLGLLGPTTDRAQRISHSVFFSEPSIEPRDVVRLSRERGGVVVVPIGQKEADHQVFFAAWLSN